MEQTELYKFGLQLKLLLAVLKVIQPMAGSNLQASYYWASFH